MFGIAAEFMRLGESPVLIAIPLFTFAGYLLCESRAAERLVKFSCVLMGWLPGGLGMLSLAACGLFTAFTGASGVTIIALGALLYPAMRRAGCTDQFSLGLVTSGAAWGCSLRHRCR